VPALFVDPALRVRFNRRAPERDGFFENCNSNVTLPVYIQLDNAPKTGDIVFFRNSGPGPNYCVLCDVQPAKLDRKSCTRRLLILILSPCFHDAENYSTALMACSVLMGRAHLSFK